MTLVLIGVVATACIDLWSLLLKRGFGVRSLDYCLLGRWVLHMPRGVFVHERIGAAQAMTGECGAGWTVHYVIGVSLAAGFVLLVSPGWLTQPTLMPALLFGVVTVVIPFVTIQPGIGLGIASSRAAKPWAARLKSLSTHAVFGMGLYVGALLVR